MTAPDRGIDDPVAAWICSLLLLAAPVRGRDVVHAIHLLRGHQYGRRNAIEDRCEVQSKPNAPDDFARGARFGAAYVDGLAAARGTISPLLDVAKVAEIRGRERGFAEASEAVDQILKDVGEEYGSDTRVLRSEVRERLAARILGIEADVVGGEG